MGGLADAASVILGVPAGDGELTLHVVRAADEDMMARLASDPWASAGLLQVAMTEPWQLWLHSGVKGVSTWGDVRKAWIAGAGDSHPTRA